MICSHLDQLFTQLYIHTYTLLLHCMCKYLTQLGSDQGSNFLVQKKKVFALHILVINNESVHFIKVTLFCTLL